MLRVIPFLLFVPLESRLVGIPPLPPLTLPRVHRVQAALAGRSAPIRVRRRRKALAFGRGQFVPHAKALPLLLAIKPLMGHAVLIRQAVGTT